MGKPVTREAQLRDKGSKSPQLEKQKPAAFRQNAAGLSRYQAYPAKAEGYV